VDAVSTIATHEQQDVDKVNATGRTPAVFVHGLWLLPSSWDRWAEVFDEAGYVALAPGWPDDPETVAEANANPDTLANKTVGDVADHFAEVIGKLDRKPVVIGHSFGGLLAQILAGRGLSTATVAIDPAPFRGVLPLPVSALRSASPVLTNPANRQEALRRICRAGPRRSAVPGRDRQLQPVDGGEGRQQEPRARAAADHLRREGSHRALGDRERLVQEAEEEQGGHHGDRRDQRPRPCAHDRQRLA
jgi:pimeloyl-ACP methyl ester carboxylesterase